MKIMICTDGSAASVQSAVLVSRFGFPAQTWMTVLGVIESEQDMEKISASMDLIEKTLAKQYKLDSKVRRGDPIDEIISEAVEVRYDLIAVGGGGTQLGLLHPQLGSTTSTLTRKLFTHFLVARNVPRELTKVLICAGVEAPTSMTITMGGQFLSNSSAKLSLLHVLPKAAVSGVVITTTRNQKENSGYSDADESHIFLSNASQQLRDAGIKGEIIPLLRYGLVVEEVLNELSQGGYELLVIGAHYQPGQDRWQGTLLDDVTDQLLNHCTCSVLII